MKKCALVIGHKKSSRGASNEASGLTEFDFNDKLSFDIDKAVSNVDVQRVYRRTYKTLPDDINELNPDFIISMHCNAFDKSASGTEALYYLKSQKGKKIATIVQKHFVDVLGLKDRGIRPKTSEDRGGYLLRYTNTPCIIAEPFFIDNNSDLEIVNQKYDNLVEAYSKAISEIAENV